MTRKSVRFTMAALLPLLLLTLSCTTLRPADDASELTTAVSVNIASLDPVAAASADSATVVQMVNEPLVYFDEQQRLRPLLATSWRPSKDGRTWTFELRRGVKFSNGEPFDANAVKFTFDRLLDPDTLNAYAGSLAVIERVRVVSTYRVEFALSKVFPALPYALTPANASIVAPGAARQAPNKPEQLAQPVGTGPYAYRKFAPNDRITVARNENYWGRRPAYRLQTIKMVPNAATREALLLAKQADVIATPPAPDLPRLRTNRSFRLIQASSGYMIQVGFNTVDDRLRDPRVRLALQVAVDRKSIIENLLFDGGAMPTSAISPNVFGYCDVGAPGYDPAKAKRLLADAGASKLKLTMQSPQGRYVADYQVAQAVAAYLRKVGVDVTLLKPPDFASYIQGLYVPPEKAKAQLSLIGWGSIFPDGSEALGNLTERAIPPKGVANFYYYANPRFEDAMRIADSSQRSDERKREYCKAQRELAKDPPALLLYVQRTTVATSGAVRGVYANNLWFVTTWARPAS